MRAGTAVVCVALVLVLAESGSTTEITGTYRNTQYGYTFEIPRPLKAVIDPPPAPQYGFRITFPDSERAFVWMDGSYNSGEARTAAAILEDVRSDIAGDATIQSVSRSTALLGDCARRPSQSATSATGPEPQKSGNKSPRCAGPAIPALCTRQA